MKKKSKQLFLLIAGLIILAAIPRSIELFSANYLFGFDQGVFFQAVRDIVVDKNPTLIGTEVGGPGGFFQGPGWYYLLAVPFVITGGDPYGAMVLMVLLGVGAVLLTFFALDSTYGRWEGIIGSILIAISPIIITQSRFIWPPFPITFLSVLFLYFLIRVLQKKGNYFPLLTFTLGLMTHFETATAATLFVNFLLLLPLIFIKRLVSLKNIIFGALTLVLSQAALIIFDLRNDFLNTRGILKLMTSESASVPIEQVFQNRWQVFIHNFVGTFPGGEYLWPVILGIILVMTYLYLKDKKHTFSKKAFLLYLIISPFTLFIIFMKYGSVMWEWWILELNVYYIFILAILLGYLLKKQYGKYIVGVLLAIMSLFFIYATYRFYLYDYNDYGGVHKIRGKIDAIDYIYTDAKGEKFNVMIFTPPIYHHEYDYLFWWYGLRKYGFEPENKMEGTVYLLIEPDPHKMWTYEGWLETVVNDGEIIFTKELPSDFIIQKRRVTNENPDR